VTFTGIADVVEETLARVPVRQAHSVGEVLEIDEESRVIARNLVSRPGRAVTARPVVRV
jgi:1-deoxy-D-xylulose 5-phosphate reductoisomerase